MPGCCVASTSAEVPDVSALGRGTGAAAGLGGHCTSTVPGNRRRKTRPVSSRKQVSAWANSPIIAPTSMAQMSRRRLRSPAGQHRRSEAFTDILLVAVDERGLRTLNVKQPAPLWSEGVCATLRRCLVDGAVERLTRVLQAEKCNHVVLVDTVAGNTDGAYESATPIDGDTAGKYLQS